MLKIEITASTIYEAIEKLRAAEVAGVDELEDGNSHVELNMVIEKV